MLHLIPIPILLMAHLIYVVADKYKLTITKKICRIVNLHDETTIIRVSRSNIQELPKVRGFSLSR